MKRLLALGLAAFMGCAGTSLKLTKTPEALTVVMEDYDTNLTYDGRNCFWSNIKPVKEEVREVKGKKYLVRLDVMAVDMGCDNHLEGRVWTYKTIRKGRQLLQIRNQVRSEIEDIAELESDLKEMRDKYGLDRLMEDWRKGNKLK